MELADYNEFNMVTRTKNHFFDLQSPRQHGINENTNRLLFQYFQKNHLAHLRAG
jgi:IS30 family transposase